MSIIKTDMAKAKEIHRNRIRESRKSKLAEQDIAFQRALETGSSTTDIIAAKQALRDAPDAIGISTAVNETDLKAQWDKSILGDPPYTYTKS